MNDATSLPAGFEALEPFVSFWVADSAAERALRRDRSDEAQRAAFYTATTALVGAALEHLDARPLASFDAREARLMKLLLAYAHVTMAVELQKDEEALHARDRHHMRITRAPADLPPA